MSRALGLALLALTCTVDLGQTSGFTENGLSLLSYQLCSYPMTRSVQKLQAVQTSYTAYVYCGGWIPWKKCPKTVYRTQYLEMNVPESRNVTDCCAGFEQLGLYCVLSRNRSREFASRPGVCPTAEPGPFTSSCSLDTDCPGLQKCCAWPGGHRCVSPTPTGTERSIVGWYNVTVLVKMGFEDLQREDPGLRNHTRLLYSLVTSALQPLNPAVHYLTSTGGKDTFTTVSWLLLGFPQRMTVANVSTMLDDMVNRVYEVISIQVQDVNECLHSELQACSEGKQCWNLEGSYQCVSPQQLTTLPSQHLNHTDKDCPPIRDFVALDVTSSSFHVSWSLNSTQNHTFHVQVYKGREILRSTWTGDRTLAVPDLEAGVLYRVRTSYQGCRANISATLVVKTDARVFQVTIRIMNRNLTEQILNCSSREFWNFSRQLFQEVENSFPQVISNMYRQGRLKMQIVSLKAGSLVVTLRLTLQDPDFLVNVGTLKPMLQPLSMSTVFQVDQQGTRVQDWDECAHSSEHDCHPAARCINLEGSYTCQCLTARDANPSRAGRVCEGDMVTPTGGGLSVETTKVKAAAVSMGITTFGPETLTLSPSSEHLRSTPAEGQASTLGPPSRRDGGSTARQDRNSTGQDVEVPNVTQNPHTTRESQEHMTKGPPFLTARSTGYVVWHPSPTWETPLKSTRPQNEDPPPSSFPGPPSTLVAVTPETPACVPGPIGKVTISNVTSTSFSLKWSADLHLSPAFCLTLVSPRGPAKTMETQHNNVTLSGLELGTLYLVEIMAKVCGKEGARTQLKVRTTAHKLTGKVRIPSMQYSESFRNASSREHQEFVQMFFRTVRDSLPATLRQHMDEGRIQVDIINITNGSVVVEFNLLMTADLDVREVSAGFLSAFQNTSMLEVVRGKTIIQGMLGCAQSEVPSRGSQPRVHSRSVRGSGIGPSQSPGTRVCCCSAHLQDRLSQNMTTTVVKTTLRNDLSPEGVIHHLQILSPIHCAFQNDLLTSSGYTPQWGVYTVIEDLHGTGNFVTEMQLFIGDSPIPQNYSVSASDEIKIEVELHRQKSNLKVVLTECWATPSSNAKDPVTFGFINNSCPVPNTYTSVIQNGNSSKAQFKLRIFSFINNSIVYLHCKLRVCMENPRNSCRINCNDFRLLRSSEAIHQMTWGPLHRSEGAQACTKPGLGTGYIILIAAAVLVVVAGAATLLILRYQRVKQKYNLRIQSDDFSYQVFSQ
eukprot:XP_008771075.1 PREDICTED: uromodulin-like 1 isoform X1 [Rattus norvegicus]